MPIYNVWHIFFYTLNKFMKALYLLLSSCLDSSTSTVLPHKSTLICSLLLLGWQGKTVKGSLFKSKIKTHDGGVGSTDVQKGQFLDLYLYINNLYDFGWLLQRVVGFGRSKGGNNSRTKVWVSKTIQTYHFTISTCCKGPTFGPPSLGYYLDGESLSAKHRHSSDMVATLFFFLLWTLMVHLASV